MRQSTEKTVAGGVIDEPAVPAGSTVSEPTPSSYDAVTMPCPTCGRLFSPEGRAIYCRTACRVGAWRRRQRSGPPVPTVAASRPRRPITVYECDACGERAVGSQRCDSCATFMRRVGYGGSCPHCDGAVAIADLLPDANI
jgi:hypothetical protein